MDVVDTFLLYYMFSIPTCTRFSKRIHTFTGIYLGRGS